MIILLLVIYFVVFGSRYIYLKGDKMKFKQLLKLLQEKWSEYDFNFGEDKKEGMSILKKVRRENNMPSTLPGEKDLTKKRK
jgi:hypothetical protein